MKSSVERANGSKDSSAESTQPTQLERRIAVMQRVPPKQQLTGVPPKQQVTGVPPKQQVTGVPPKQQVTGVPPKQQVTRVPPKQQVTADDASERSVAERRIAAMRPKRYIGGAAKDIGESEVTDRPKEAWGIIITPSRSS